MGLGREIGFATILAIGTTANGLYCGECVSFIKLKMHKLLMDLVLIGKYSGHAAIYTGQDANGIQVWDQWVGHPVSQRTIRWNGSGISNNGDSFYVIN
ncbi:unnamed protein product [Didymodactylos carnosus]|uniref:Uncharacterized protein n=1 Tax=Didymodactylos carnosus TaxID=1234261 RepID=A0A8S2QIF2_9BILA|nr:unnamed protein product [Didymodactylos carnosus]CAF4114255.1 unnamed protein product [Didymodactylos carnosus]